MLTVANEMTPYSPATPTRTILVPEIVPFELYRSKRKQYGWLKKPVVYFRTETCEGIPLMDALHGQTHDLLGRQDPVLEGCGDKVSFHIHFHGYSPLKCQKYSYYQRHGKKFANTRSKVARQIAEAVQDFIDKRQCEYHSGEGRVGPGFIELKDLYLLELHHVASGCFQPILGYLPPRPAASASYLLY